MLAPSSQFSFLQIILGHQTHDILGHQTHLPLHFPCFTGIRFMEVVADSKNTGF